MRWSGASTSSSSGSRSSRSRRGEAAAKPKPKTDAPSEPTGSAGTRTRSAPARPRTRPASFRSARPRPRSAAARRRRRSTLCTAQDLDLRVRDVAALVDLRGRRQEVELETSPISTTSNSAVVGWRVGREHHPAAVPAPFATITSCIRPRRSPSSSETVTSVFFHERNTRVRP